MGNEPLLISQIFSKEKENTFESKKIPEKAVASKGINENQHIISLNTVVNETPGIVELVMPKSHIATVKQVQLDALTHSEQKVEECYAPFQSQRAKELSAVSITLMKENEPLLI